MNSYLGDPIRCGETYLGLPAHLYATLRISAEKYPDKCALREADGASVTFAQFKARVDSFSVLLAKKYRVQPGDVCAILSVNSIDFCVAFYAILRCGAVALPLSTKCKSIDLLFPMVHSGCRILIMDAQWMDQVKPIASKTKIKDFVYTGEASELRICSPAQPSEPILAHNGGAAILYTSGTTGKPRAAMLTHRNLLHAIESYRRIVGLDHHDSSIIAIPIFNVTGLVALLALFVAIGGTLWLLPRFDGEKMVRTCFENDITFVHGSPTIFIKMLEQQDKYPKLPALTKGACGSANLPMEVLRRLHDWIPDFRMYTVFGMTETSSPATIMPDDPLVLGKPNSSGLPIPGVEIRIADTGTGRPLPAGCPGALLVRGSTVITSYWGVDAVQNAVAFKDGWLDTGDIAKVDKDGYLYILDRRKDMINRGGEKIFSIEVENLLATHPAVAECAVVGKADAVLGETVCAYVRLKPGSSVDAESLKTFMYGKLATYKLPVQYYFVEAFPKNPNGKICKNELREMLEATSRLEKGEDNYGNQSTIHNCCGSS